MAIKDSALEPELLPHAAFFWRAYSALTRCRVWMEGRPLAIPLTEIEAYTRLHQYDADLTEDLLYYVDRLEGVYFEWFNKQSKKKMNTGKGVGAPKPRRK